MATILFGTLVVMVGVALIGSSDFSLGGLEGVTVFSGGNTNWVMVSVSWMFCVGDVASQALDPSVKIIRQQTRG